MRRLHVYSVKAWEEFSWHGKDPSSYWNSAIPLKDWEKTRLERGLDSSEWEILFPPSAVKDAKPVSNKRIITSQPKGSSLRYALMWTLEKVKASKSVQW